jgi:hypothetical protein
MSARLTIVMRKKLFRKHSHFDYRIQNFRIAGLTMSGFFLSFLFYPILPEILSIAQNKEGILDDYNLIDKACGIYGVFFSLGNMLSVIVGDIIYYQIFNLNFRTTCDAMSVLSIAFAVIFLFTNVGLNTFKEKPQKDQDPIYEKFIKEFMRKQSNVEPWVLDGKTENAPPMFVLDR